MEIPPDWPPMNLLSGEAAAVSAALRALWRLLDECEAGRPGDRAACFKVADALDRGQTIAVLDTRP